jgi:hypothetical protein
VSGVWDKEEASNTGLAAYIRRGTQNTREVLAMTKLSRRAPEIEVDFTDEALTAVGGSVFLSGMARRLGLEELLESALDLKQRRRGASEAEMVLSAVYSLAAGDGALRDVDRLRADQPRIEALGLEEIPGSRRLGEYLARFDDRALSGLMSVSRAAAGQVAPGVIEHQVQNQGYVGVFLDGTAIEVDGEYMEGVKPGYNGQPQLWLHNGFIGGLWASQRLWPGGTGVSYGWQQQLDQDIAPMIPPQTPVWLRMDNAYYQREIVDWCRERGWDFSISVTSGTYKKPLRDKVDRLLGIDWQWINDDHTESAALVRHRPSGWRQEETFVVIRSDFDGTQRRLVPRHTFILVSRTDLPLRELVKRHRLKQGQENAQKGPLVDLDLHHPPCQRLHANRAFYTCGQLAQILLVAIQYELLPESARIHGLRTLIRDLVRTAARLVHHARKRVLKFAKTALRLDWIIHAAQRLDAMAHT